MITKKSLDLLSLSGKGSNAQEGTIENYVFFPLDLEKKCILKILG